MHADHVEVSWDASKSSWLLKIEAGEELVRWHALQADEMLMSRHYGRPSRKPLPTRVTRAGSGDLGSPISTAVPCDHEKPFLNRTPQAGHLWRSIATELIRPSPVNSQ